MNSSETNQSYTDSDSQKRGKTGCLWVLVAFFTWPFGVIAYWVLHARGEVTAVKSEGGELVMEDRQAQLARYYIEEYFRQKGWTMEKVHDLPLEVARQLWIEASSYAALKLTEVESRAHIVHELHGITETKT